MAETAAPAPVEIPQRALFKAAEVCDLVQVQPYVLRSWEAEFPELGFAKAAGGPRVYRREDVEQVLRIKHLLLVEGLTLAGARRKLEDEIGPVAADLPVIDELIGQNARERLTQVKRGLRSILELLDPAAPVSSQTGAVPRTRPLAASRTKSAGKASAAKRVSARSAQPRRDRQRSARPR
jgi:DNA-binding transcriptional MerR regulator